MKFSNHEKKTIIALVIIAVLTLGLVYFSRTRSNESNDDSEVFKNEILLKTTPVKDQGNSMTCWIYSMLATIETDRIEQNDSINLSPIYLERCLMNKKAIEAYFGKKITRREMAGMTSACLTLLEQYGVLPFDSYHLLKPQNTNAIAFKAIHLARKDAARKIGLNTLNNDLNEFLDDQLGILPQNVYMFGVEYTPLQFAQSLDFMNKYKGYTSVTHHPFYTDVAIESPDNTTNETFYNVPIDTLMAIIDTQLEKHKAVCWEGGIPKKEFSFSNGIAKLSPKNNVVTQQWRQQNIESLSTTDQHAMTILGRAHNNKGETYYIAKNSWGTNNKYKGFVYLSKNFVRLRTIAITTKTNE